MKSRNREVNIVNMSLLDILCGALGAFCFMMLVLLPYWKPKGATAEDLEKKYQEVTREMDQIKKQLEKIPGSGDLQKRLDKITKGYDDQNRQLNQARKEAEQAKKENETLRLRRPMAITMAWSSARHNVDLYIRYRGKSGNGKEQDPPDASKEQSIFFTGDRMTNCSSGPCADTWLVRDVPTGTEYEVYYKFMDAKGNPEPANITSVSVNAEGGFWVLPTAQIPREKTSVFVGVLKFDTNEKLTFEPQPDYAAIFKEMNKDRLAPPAPK
jgi:hypothetical protein